MSDETKVIEIVVKAVGDADLKRLGEELQRMRKEAAATRQEVEKINKSVSGFGASLKRFGGLIGVGFTLKGLISSSEQIQLLNSHMKELSETFIDAAFDASGLTEAISDPLAWKTATEGAKTFGDYVGLIGKQVKETARLFGLMPSNFIGQKDIDRQMKEYGETHVIATGDFKEASDARGQNYVAAPFNAQDWGDLDRAAQHVSESMSALGKEASGALQNVLDNREAWRKQTQEMEKDAQLLRDAMVRPMHFALDTTQFEADMDAAARATQEVDLNLEGISESLAQTVMDTRQWGDLWATAAVAASDAYQELEDAAQDRTTMLLDMADQLTYAFTDLFTGGIKNARDFFRVVLQGFAQVAAQRAAIGASSSGLKWLSGLLGAAASPASGGDGYLEQAIAAGVSAKGNAFSGGNVLALARGGIVSRPTLFPMARGLGLMGEAGPEAVMPLRRGADGRLGVSAPRPQVVVNNQTGVAAQADVVSSDERLEITLRAAQMGANMAVTEVNRSIRSGYGATAGSLARSYGLRRRT